MLQIGIICMLLLGFIQGYIGMRKPKTFLAACFVQEITGKKSCDNLFFDLYGQPVDLCNQSFSSSC